MLGPLLGLALAQLLALAQGLALPQGKLEEHVLVVGPRFQGVTFQGSPWQPVRNAVEGTGKGNAIYCERALGGGDFAIRLKLAIAKPGNTQAALELGDSAFVLDGDKGAMVATGPLFGPATTGPTTPTTIADAAKKIFAGKPFDLEARRTAGKLTILVEGQVVLEASPGDRAVGRIGVAPENAHVQIVRFAVSGALAAPSTAGAPLDIQPAIDAAVERGVSWLLARQIRDGSWQNDCVSFPGGQTALSTYTLLRAGLTPKHPALARALEYLAHTRPTDTYSAGLFLMAFEATADPAYREPMRGILKELLSWQSAESWSYAPGPRPGAVYDDALPRTDLSNLQYAVLGMRAAEHAGLEVPDEAWTRALDATLSLQEQPVDIESPRKDGKTGTAKLSIAGFRYRPDRGVCGSMTCAGLVITQICRDMLGRRIKGPTAVQTARAIQLGTAFLDYRFNLEQNFGDSEALNHYYYIYGLERVGTLLNVERYGEHPWYLEGAQWLIKHQEPEGTWATRGAASSGWREIQEEIDTCFSILFLERASRPTVRTGDNRVQTPPSRDPTSPVTLCASGRTDVVLWIGGFGDAALARANGLQIAYVEYLVGSSVVGRVEGDPAKPWTDESYSMRHSFDDPGSSMVFARVHLGVTDEILESKPVKVFSDGTLQLWMTRAASARERNLLLQQPVTVTATSVNVDGQEAPKAVDGIEGTVWVCKDVDLEPMLTLEWAKPVKADELVLNGACTRRSDLGKYDRIRRVSVRLNKEKESFEAEMEKDEMQPTIVALPKGAQVRRIEIRVVEREAGGQWKGHCGFTEVALEKRP